MKKLLCICFFAATIFLAGAVTASAYVYTLDIDITNPGLITEDEFMIGGIEFVASGGEYGVDWQLSLGGAVPPNGNWIFENFGGWNLLYDDYDIQLKDYAPLGGGNALTITSNVELTFSNISFADFKERDVNEQYFTTEGFVEQSTVPIPGGIILLGSGLLGLLGVTRRR